MEQHTNREPDRYDKAIAYLEAHPSEIASAWANPFFHPGGALFLYVTHNSGESIDLGRGRFKLCGCLTQVRRGTRDAETEELTEEIRNDTRIPRDFDNVGINNLAVFAEWQRRLDRELRS
jgi:hypothetical protein